MGLTVLRCKTYQSLWQIRVQEELKDVALPKADFYQCFLKWPSMV